MMILEDDYGYKTSQEEEGAVQASPLSIRPETLSSSEDEKLKDKKSKKKMAAGFIIAGAVIVALAVWQIMESINFNKAARDYMTHAEEIKNNIDAATKSDTYTLIQVLHELNRLKRQNEDLLLNAGELIEKNKFVLFKDKSVVSKINNNQKTLETLLLIVNTFGSFAL